MFLSKRGKFEIRDDSNQALKVALEHNPDAQVSENHRNWLEVIKSGGTPQASIDVGYRSAAVVHLGNIATRLSRTLQFDVQKEQFVNDTEANGLLGRTYRKEGHWGVPG
jgi:hypothetical protein